MKEGIYHPQPILVIEDTDYPLDPKKVIAEATRIGIYYIRWPAVDEICNERQLYDSARDANKQARYERRKERRKSSQS